MDITFTKMSGAGNDFVVIDNRRRQIQGPAELARKLCDRRWGIGADGLLLLEESPAASYRMMYYNADGSYGGMCGNGGRCIALYAVMIGAAGSEHRFEALDHVYEARVRDNTVTLKMKDPRVINSDLVLRIGGKRIKALFLDTGSPHVVLEAKRVARKGLHAIQVSEIGRRIRNLAAFRPGGTNVNFIEITGDNIIHIRTYERGVEAETQACGTGSIAAAIAASNAGLAAPFVIEPASGRRLTVDFAKRDGKISDVELRGPAEVIYKGQIRI